MLFMLRVFNYEQFQLEWESKVIYEDGTLIGLKISLRVNFEDAILEDQDEVLEEMVLEDTVAEDAPRDQIRLLAFIIYVLFCFTVSV